MNWTSICLWVYNEGTRRCFGVHLIVFYCIQAVFRNIGQGESGVTRFFMIGFLFYPFLSAHVLKDYV